MSSTVFIALQCCQCSTMQVKQKKKSSNKWICAVCNQKQSVRKVFAQGYMAKDIRLFVQSFNMSRSKSLPDQEEEEWLPSAHDRRRDAEDRSDSPANRNKKRCDWTAYLDQDQDATQGGQQEQQHGDDFEPLVVTELPKGMLKKRRLVDSSTAGSHKLIERPLFPNSQDAKEPVKDQQRITVLTESNSERNNKVTPGNQRTQKCKETISSAASKWNGYLAEDNDNLELGWKRGFNSKDHSGSCNNTILEATTSEQRVEDDIHPDFM